MFESTTSLTFYYNIIVEFLQLLSSGEGGGGKDLEPGGYGNLAILQV